MREYRFLVWLLVVVVGLVVGGCGASLKQLGNVKVTETKTNGTEVVTERSGAVDVELAGAAAEEACWQAQEALLDKGCDGLSEAACERLRMRQHDLHLFSLASGKQLNPCQRTNLNDVFVAEVREKNATARQGIKTSGTVGIVKIGADAVEGVLKTFAQESGDTITAKDSTVSTNREQTEIHYTQTNSDEAANGTTDNSQEAVAEEASETSEEESP